MPPNLNIYIYRTSSKPSHLPGGFRSPFPTWRPSNHFGHCSRSKRTVDHSDPARYQSLDGGGSGVCFSYVHAMVQSRVILGMGNLPPLIGNPYNGYINPYYWVDEFIPYYMEIMGVDRPDRTYDTTPKPS